MLLLYYCFCALKLVILMGGSHVKLLKYLSFNTYGYKNNYIRRVVHIPLLLLGVDSKKHLLASLTCYHDDDTSTLLSEMRLEGWLSLPVRNNTKKFGWEKKVRRKKLL